LINPDNLGTEANADGGDDEYFTDKELLDRVPTTLLYLSGIYFVVFVIAQLLIKVPEPDLSEQTGTNDSFGTFFKKVLKLALGDKRFYILWITRFGLGMVTLSVSGFYKSFGLTFGDNLDQTISTIGAVSNLFNCVSRIIFGFIMDKTSYKTAVAIETFCLTILVATFPFTKNVGIEMFAAWLWGIYLLFPAIYALLPACCNKLFGSEYGAAVYGIMFSADLIFSPSYGAINEPIQNWGGYTGYFLIMSAFCGLSFLVNLTFPRAQKTTSEPSQG